MVIRQVTKDDLPEVARIQVNGWKTAYAGIIDGAYLDVLDEQEKLKKLEASHNKNGFVVAEADGRVVGFCRYVADNSFTPSMDGIDCEITALYVDSDLKGKGIGTELFRFVEEEFRRMGRKRMVIWCFKDNMLARGFYEKMGGKVVAEKTSDIGGKQYIEIGLEYNL